MIFLVVSKDILDLHSLVNVAECGLKRTFLLLSSELFLSTGSFSKTSTHQKLYFHLVFYLNHLL